MDATTQGNAVLLENACVMRMEPTSFLLAYHVTQLALLLP
jgi:hypothetical protein